MRTVEQRRQDVRLAWLIVGVCGAITLVLAILLGATLARRAVRQMDEGLRQARSDAERRGTPVTTLPAPPPPPNTARPVGDVARWVGTDDYPQTAIRAGDEGRVRVTLAIDADGKPTGCAVAMSSGSSSLDNATCLTMMSRGRFDRATPGGAGSRPGEVRRWTSPPVRWVLPD